MHRKDRDSWTSSNRFAPRWQDFLATIHRSEGTESDNWNDPRDAKRIQESIRDLQDKQERPKCEEMDCNFIVNSLLRHGRSLKDSIPKFWEYYCLNMLQKIDRGVYCLHIMVLYSRFWTEGARFTNFFSSDTVKMCSKIFIRVHCKQLVLFCWFWLKK